MYLHGSFDTLMQNIVLGTFKACRIFIEEINKNENFEFSDSRKFYSMQIYFATSIISICAH